MNQPPKIVVIVGPTASGKSSIAMEVASRFNGEIICADSRTIYKEMDIGTAKPSSSDQTKIKHHLLDIVDIDQDFTVANFKELANKAIKDICIRGKLPILVGGSGLYIDSLIYDFSFRYLPNKSRRTELNNLSVEELQDIIIHKSLPMPTNSKNPRHLITVIESSGAKPNKNQLRENTLLIGINLAKEKLSANIEKRLDSMFNDGLEKEAQKLFTKYGEDYAPLKTIGYQEFIPYINGVESINNVYQKILVHSKQYAKRQITWFKRNQDINWVVDPCLFIDIITTFLDNK